MTTVHGRRVSAHRRQLRARNDRCRPSWPDAVAGSGWVTQTEAARCVLSRCGRAMASSKLAALCSERPSRPSHCRGPSEATIALMSGAIFATDLTPSKAPTRRSHFGSRPRSSATGSPTPSLGFMSKPSAAAWSWILFVHLARYARLSPCPHQP